MGLGMDGRWRLISRGGNPGLYAAAAKQQEVEDSARCTPVFRRIALFTAPVPEAIAEHSSSEPLYKKGSCALWYTDNRERWSVPPSALPSGETTRCLWNLYSPDKRPVAHGTRMIPERACADSGNKWQEGNRRSQISRHCLLAVRRRAPFRSRALERAPNDKEGVPPSPGIYRIPPRVSTISPEIA